MKQDLTFETHNLTSPRREFELNLEFLRGFAAVVVIFHHAIKMKFSLDPRYNPTGIWGNYLPGHTSVLIFFIISGYVIGLTNKKSLTKKDIFPYLRKRFVRLYPIYIISLLFALIVANEKYSFLRVLGHFFFLQTTFVIIIRENIPLWSLGYEVVYYLAFIPISYLGIGSGRLFTAISLIGILFSVFMPQHAVLSSYSLGFMFWTSGLWLAQSQAFAKAHSSRMFLVGLLCLFLGNEFLNPFVTMSEFIVTKFNIHIARPGEPAIFFSDIFQFPFCFYLFLRFSNHSTSKSNFFITFTAVAGILHYVLNVYMYGINSNQVHFLFLPVAFFSMGIFLLITSKFFLQVQAPRPFPALCIKLGSISYGIYVIHYPISVMLSHITILSGTAFYYTARLVVDLILVLAIGWFLELKVQPWFKARLSLTLEPVKN